MPNGMKVVFILLYQECTILTGRLDTYVLLFSVTIELLAKCPDIADLMVI